MKKTHHPIYVYGLAVIFMLAAIGDNALACCATAAVQAAHMKTDMLIESQHQSTVTNVNTNTTKEATLIRDKIEEVGSVLQQETRAQTSSTSRMFEAQNQLLRDLFMSAGLAQEKSIIDRVYGERSLPSTGCESIDLGASIRNGGTVMARIKNSSVEKAVAHTNKYERAMDAKQAAQKMLETAPAADQLANIMFTNIVEKDNQKQMIESIMYLTDPQPPRPLTSNEKNKDQAIEYESQRNLRNRHMALVQQVLADHIARRMPSMPLGGWASEQWKNMGGQGKPPGVVDGYMSESSVIDMLVESRIGNPNWTTVTVPQLNDTGLKREQLYMDAARLYIEREQMKMMEQILVLNALNIANRLTTETDAKLQQMSLTMEQ